MKRNTIQLTCSFIFLLISFIGINISNYWILWGLAFVVFLAITLFLLDRRENLRKGWK